MRVRFHGDSVTLTRQSGDPKFFGTAGAKGEHALFAYLQRYLNARGNDLVKKRAQSDGHMMGDQYMPILRTRSPRSSGLQVIIYNGRYAIEGANEPWNRGSVTLAVHRKPWVEGRAPAKRRRSGGRLAGCTCG